VAAGAPRFLIVKLGALGDLTFALPAPQHLKARFPGCRVDWAVSEALSPLLEGHPWVDRILRVDSAALHDGPVWARGAAVLRARRDLPDGYDLVFLFHRSRAHLAYLLGKGPIVRMDRRGDSGFTAGTCRVHCPPRTRHESRQIQHALVEGLRRSGLGGGTPEAWRPDLGHLLPTHPPNRTGTRIGLHLGGGRNAGATFDLKQWPHMATLGRALLETTTHGLALFGAPEDRPAADRFLADLADPGLRDRIQDCVGRTDLPRLVQGIAGCAAFVGPDSGPLHLADTLGIPVLGLYGPTSPEAWGPLGAGSAVLVTRLACQPCYQDDGRIPDCLHQHQCMVGLTAASVYATLMSMLEPRPDMSPR